MKKFNLYAVLLCAVLTFSSGVFAQKQSETTAKAVELMSSGDFRGAIAVLDKAIAKNKDLFESYKMRAMLKRITGDFAGALNDYNSAIELKADDGELYEQRAMMRLYTRQSPELTLEDLNLAISYGRKYERIYSMRGMIRTQLGDREGAIADYETAIGLRPDFAGAYIGLAGVYSMSRDDEKAISILEKFVGIIENSGVVTPSVKGEVVTSNSVPVPAISDNKSQVTEGTVIIKGIEGRRTTGSTQTSENINQKTENLEQTKNTAAAYSFLAGIYERRQDYERASLLVEKALKIDPADFTAYEIRGKIKTGKGDYQGAIRDFDTALKIMPGVPTMYLERGIAKLLSGSEAEAQKDFDKFLQMFPNGKMMLDSRINQAKQKLQQ